MKQTTKAWALKGELPDHQKPTYFLGIFNCVHGPLLPCQDGMRTCLFRTRKEARAEEKQHKWVKARAVRVSVEIKEVDP